MVYYLKYRPQNLDELDNRRVAETIDRYLSRNSTPHAFLFAGPKGTGKTSTARIVAKSINCPQTQKFTTACGKCQSCLTISRGDSLDVLEIDAASNRGIDEIRDLREKIKFSPLILKYKVYIIDEVHMLTSEAFNALLKTLEEPPKHAVFILATTELYKLPATIISRCVQVDFHKATTDEIGNSLTRIIKGEKLEVEDKALAKISELADGSFRDAAKLIEELSTHNKKITLELVRVQTQLADTNLEMQFLEFLKAKNAKELMLLIKILNDSGKNIRQFFTQILNRLHEALIDQVTKNDQTWKDRDLIRALELFGDAFSQLKISVIPSLPFELAVVDYCFSDDPTLINNSGQSAAVTTSTTTASGNGINEKWNQLLEILKPQNHSIVGVLRSCRPIKLDEKEVVIEAAFKFHAEKLNEAKTHELLVKAVTQLIGKPAKVIIELKKRS